MAEEHSSTLLLLQDHDIIVETDKQQNKGLELRLSKILGK